MLAKTEERFIKTLKAWLVFGRGFCLEEIIEMEAKVLHSLDFKRNLPTSLSFFHVFSTYYSVKSRAMCLCTYLVELTLIDCRYLKYKGHVIGLGTIYLSHKILNITARVDISHHYGIK
jgi:hypothetical protein